MCLLAIVGLVVGMQATTGPRIVHASVFRNGYALVTREVPVTRSSDIQIDDVPDSAFGTLWFASTPGVRIKQITSTEIPYSTSSQVGSLEDLLRINIGHEVNLTLKDLPNATGTLRSVQGELVILVSGGTERVVFKSQILGLSSPSELTKGTTGTGSKRVLRVRAEAAGAGDLYIVSLERGIGWEPAYLAELKGSTLTLTSRATIVDDLAELGGIDVLLATLSPNISSQSRSETLLTGTFTLVGGSRLLGGQGLVGDSIDFISYDPSDNSLVVRGNEDNVNSLSESHHQNRTVPATWAQATGLEGVKKEDQFFYRQPDVRLKRGERGQFVLYQKDVPYLEEYSLDIASTFDSGGILTPNSSQQVFHNLAFKNTTGQPLTEAVVSTMQDGQFLGQTKIGSTPSGGEVEYVLGSAPEIQAEITEEEVNRTRDVLKKGKESFGLVTMKGTLSIHNLSKKTVKMRIFKQIVGELIESSKSPTVHKAAASLSSINATTSLRWTPEIAAGQSLLIAYQYRAYVQN